jgi:hypothetical protein
MDAKPDRNYLRLTFLLCGVIAGLVIDSDVDAADVTFPLTFHASGRYLVDQNDSPFLINGDTPWGLIPALTKSETEVYLDDRVQKGFNSILLELVENYFNGPANVEGQQPFLQRGDFSSPNEAYFAHADWVISEASSRGVLVFLVPAYLGYNCGAEGWCSEIVSTGAAGMRDYGRFLGERYRNYDNIIWVAGGDTNAQDHSGAMQATEAMIDGIKEFAPDHLFTAHCSRDLSAIQCYDRPWLDLNNTYSDCNETAARSLSDYRRSQPFFYLEGTYEGEQASAVCIRSQAYWSILSGSMGHFFGNNPVWHFESPRTLFPYSGTWQSAMDATGSVSMMHLANLFASRQWTALIPDDGGEFVTSSHGNERSSSYLASAVNSARTTLFVYMPSSRSVTVDTTPLQGDQVQAWWYNPRTGGTTNLGSFDEGESSFSPPQNGDWVLVLDDAALNLAAPGSPGSVRPNPPEDLRTS